MLRLSVSAKSRQRRHNSSWLMSTGRTYTLKLLFKFLFTAEIREYLTSGMNYSYSYMTFSFILMAVILQYILVRLLSSLKIVILKMTYMLLTLRLILLGKSHNSPGLDILLLALLRTSSDT